MNWTCPYCNRDQVVTKGQKASVEGVFFNGGSDVGMIGVYAFSIVCANTECRKALVVADITGAKRNPHYGLVIDRECQQTVLV